MGKWGDRKYIGCGMNKKGIPDVREVCRGGDITTVISGLFSLRDRECRQNSNRENSSGFSEIRVFLLNREDEMNSSEFFEKPLILVEEILTNFFSGLMFYRTSVSHKLHYPPRPIDIGF